MLFDIQRMRLNTIFVVHLRTAGTNLINANLKFNSLHIILVWH